MSMTTTISSLSPEDMQIISESMNTYLNMTIMEASLFGIYTGVFCATMWSIFSSERSKSGRGKQIMVTIISCLFILEAVTFGTDWSFSHSAFIQNGWDLFTVFGALRGRSSTSFRMSLTINIDGGISTILADISMIWRCWTVWGRRWPVIILPTLCSLAGTATKAFQAYHDVHDITYNIADTNSYQIETMWTISYLSLSVATTTVCTILIICRIFVAGRSNHGGIQLYRGVIEILVESALLYSVTLLIYTVFVARNNPGGSYFDVITSVARGIAPTLIVGRVAAGHARPNDSWTSSPASSLRFGASPGGQSQGTTDEETGGQEGHCLAESFGGHINGNCGPEEEAVSGHANESSQTMARIIQS